MSTPGTDPGSTPGDRSGDPELTRALPQQPRSETPHDTRDDWPTTSGGETYVASGGADDPRRKRRGTSHLLGTVVSLLAVLAALLLLDYSIAHGWPADETSDALPPTEAWVTMAVGAGLLLLVALLARASGPGTLLAGLVWGVLPTVALVLRPARFADVVRDLPDPYAGLGDGLLTATAVFPVVGALLVGIGLAGRWRAKRPVEA